MTFDEALGETVRSARRRRKLKLAEAAGVLGVTPSAVSRLENGRTQMNIVQLRMLSRFYGVAGFVLLAEAERRFKQAL